MENNNQDYESKVNTNSKTKMENKEPVTQSTEPVKQHKEPVTHSTETINTHVEGQNARRITGAVFGAIEIILAFRFVFKLFGANPDSEFVKFLYGLTGIFVNIFKGIFAEMPLGGSDSNAVFEPSSILAIIIVALIALLVFKLMTPKDKSTNLTSSTSSTRPGNK